MFISIEKKMFDHVVGLALKGLICYFVFIVILVFFIFEDLIKFVVKQLAKPG